MNPRSKKFIALGMLALGIGVISKTFISYPIKILPTNNQEITIFLKIKNVWLKDASS